MSVDTTQNERLEEVEEMPEKKEDKVLVDSAMALTILICSTTFVTYDYIQNIHILKNPEKEKIQWLTNLMMYLSGIVVLLFSLLSDCAFQDYYVELAEAVMSSFGYVVVVAINFIFPFSNLMMKVSLFPFLLQTVTTPNSWAFLLRQARFIKVDIDKVLSITLTGTLTVVSAFKIASELIRYFADEESLSHLFTIWQLISSLCRILILLMISNRVSRADVSFGPIATIFLVTFYYIRGCIRRVFNESRAKKFQDVDIFYTKRFWFVVSILFFYAPLGLGSMCIFVVSKVIETYLLKTSTSLLENFQSYYFIGGSVLTFFYFFGLAPLLKKKKFWTKELRHLGVCYVLLAVAVAYIGMLQSFVYAQGLRMKEGYAHMRIFNLVNSSVEIESNIISTTILAFSMFSFSEKTSAQFDWHLEIHSEEKEINEKTSIVAYKGKWNIYTISETGIERLENDFELSAKSRGEPPILFHLSNSNATLYLRNGEKSTIMKPSEKVKLESEGDYKIEVTTSNISKFINWHFDQDSIYGIFISEPITEESLKIFSLKKPRTIDIKWIIPCAAILGMVDMVELYVCMKFIFFQGPPQLRTLAVAICFFMIHSTSIIYVIPSLDLPNFELFVFIVLSIVIMFFSLFIYTAMKYIPYVFTTNGKF